MSYFICPACQADNIEFIHDVRMIEYYEGNNIDAEEDIPDNGGFVSIKCMECNNFTDNPVELDDWIA